MLQKLKEKEKKDALHSANIIYYQEKKQVSIKYIVENTIVSAKY